jgi:hypothetical protein
MIKLCKDCSHFKKEVIQTPQGYVNMAMCVSENCRDVVSGDPIPCGAARQQPVFCGFEARHFRENTDKVEDAKVITLVQKP